MPGVGSWDGKWTGSGDCHVIVRSVTNAELAHITIPAFYRYDFGDGWAASIAVHPVADSTEARKLRRRSDGFCGYNWMVDEIIAHGRIKPFTEKLSP